MINQTIFQRISVSLFIIPGFVLGLLFYSLIGLSMYIIFKICKRKTGDK